MRSWTEIMMTSLCVLPQHAGHVYCTFLRFHQDLSGRTWCHIDEIGDD